MTDNRKSKTCGESCRTIENLKLQGSAEHAGAGGLAESKNDREGRTMSPNKFFISVAASLILFTSIVIAQEKGMEKMGRVQFPVSCTAAAQKQFDQALGALHSFWYEEALRLFTAVTETDPGCAMGYWGIAMSIYYPLWVPPSQATLQKGINAIEKAKSIGAKTDREGAYIAAIEAFYKDSDKLDHRTRTVAYEKALERIHVQYPNDREAAIFYALALNATAPPTDKTYVKQLKAGEILEKVFAEQPDHPGVAHYIIHSYDNPILASRGIPAAQRYTKIAPSVPHAQHMPSHIFTRIGLWQESIQSNRGAVAASKAYAAKAHPGAAYYEHLHALDYLAYAYLQGAQDREAEGVLDELRAIKKVQPEAFQAAYAYAAIPARYALERRRWSEAAALTVAPTTFPWSRFPWAEAVTHFARAMGSARSGNAANARKDIEKLESLQDALIKAKDSYWAKQVDIQRRVATAWFLRAERKNDEALQLMQSAADLEDSTDKHPVTPAPIQPARELLGEMLLELGDPAQAIKEFEASHRIEPNRFRGLYGAAKAAQASGDREKARHYYAKLISLCERADTDRPEIKEAKAYLTK
jgi:tetratricopeptide (TPR) repeat protein